MFIYILHALGTWSILCFFLYRQPQICWFGRNSYPWDYPPIEKESSWGRTCRMLMLFLVFYSRNKEMEEMRTLYHRFSVSDVLIWVLYLPVLWMFLIWWLLKHVIGMNWSCHDFLQTSSTWRFGENYFRCLWRGLEHSLTDTG